MGIYVNPGNTAFRKALNSEIYIDKTGLIAATNRWIDTINCFMRVSRPRRFGRSMAADMLAAYYSKGCDSRSLFAGRKAEKEPSFQTHLNQYDVIRLDIQQFLESKHELDSFITTIEQTVIQELREEFSECENLSTQFRLKTALNQIFARTGKGFIFIIDEWDCVFRLAKERKDIQKDYLDFLRGLFKGQNYVNLAYMTGILPVKKYGEHSALNIFDEYSMASPKNLDKYFGFTEEEVEEQREKYDIEFAEMKKWYDGYLLGQCHIYNPKSVADALMWKTFQSYIYV